MSATLEPSQEQFAREEAIHDTLDLVQALRGECANAVTREAFDQVRELVAEAIGKLGAGRGTPASLTKESADGC